MCLNDEGRLILGWINPPRGLFCRRSRRATIGARHVHVAAPPGGYETVTSTNGVRNPLNRSQTLVAISKMPIGESNHHRFTTLAKSGKMMKTKVHDAHHPDEITPKAANALGI